MTRRPFRMSGLILLIERNERYEKRISKKLRSKRH